MQAPANDDAEAYSGADTDTNSDATSDSREVNTIILRRSLACSLNIASME